MLQYLFGKTRSSDLIRYEKHARSVRTDEPCVFFKYYFEQQDFNEINFENKSDAEATADYYPEDNSFGSVLGGEWNRNNWFNNRTKEQANEYATHVLKDSIEYIKEKYPDTKYVYETCTCYPEAWKNNGGLEVKPAWKSSKTSFPMSKVINHIYPDKVSDLAHWGTGGGWIICFDASDEERLKDLLKEDSGN